MWMNTFSRFRYLYKAFLHRPSRPLNTMDPGFPAKKSKLRERYSRKVPFHLRTPSCFCPSFAISSTPTLARKVLRAKFKAQIGRVGFVLCPVIINHHAGCIWTLLLPYCHPFV